MDNLADIDDPSFNLPQEDVVDLMTRRRMAQSFQINQGYEHSPDDAAQALQLSDVTGDPAPAILPNLEDYTANVRKATARELVLNNPDLVTYMQAHPLAATVSADDWGNLDKFTRESAGLSGMLNRLNAGMQAAHEVLNKPFEAIGEDELKGVVEGWQGGNVMPSDAEYQRMQQAYTRPGAAVAKAALSVMDLATQTMGAVGGGLIGIAGGVGKALGGEALEREAKGIAESELNRQMAEGLHPADHVPEPPMLSKVRPWIEAGEEPPRGVAPEIDAAKAEVNAAAVEEMEKSLANVQASTTHERSPDMMAKLIESKFGDTHISISAEAAQALYGDKPPAPDDGLLGWVPNINEQLAAARDTGDDVSVPLKDWLARVDPAVAKGLHDDLRMWPGGITAREAGEPPVPSKAVVAEPLPQVRASLETEPKFGWGDRKVELALAEKELDEDSGFEKHDYDINDENGKPVGRLRLTPAGDRTLYVDYIGGKAGLWANSFGPALMRDLKGQLKALYPDYDYLTGHRVTGARVGEAAAGGETPMPLPRVRLAADEYTQADHERMQDIFAHGAWRQFNEDIAVKGGGLTPDQATFGQAAMDELNRITGGQAQVVGTTGIQLRGGTAQGLYVPSRDQAPHILLNLLHPDVAGIGRHEAIHFLKNNNFFTPEEWKILDNAAFDEKWHERYGIEQRYKDMGLTGAEKREEAIAEAFREWARQAPDMRPKTGVGALFQKLWDFMEGIRRRFGEAIGREPTWEEVFQRVHSGEVGGRPPGEPEPGAFDLRARASAPEAGEPVEGLANLQAKSVGLPADAFAKLQDRIRRQQADQIATALKRTTAAAEKRNSAEWRANRREMQKEVAANIRQRPDIAADLFLGSGEHLGTKIRQRFTLAADSLSPEQKAVLPGHYISADGLPPDYVASMFGYSGRDELVSALGRIEAAKRTADGGRMQPLEFMNKLVNAETDRQMEARYGTDAAEALSQARDQAVNEGAINVLHEELTAAAQQIGQTVFDKDAMRQAAANIVGSQSLGSISSARVANTMAKHGRMANAALLGGDFETATKAMTQQTLATMVYAEARKVEKEMGQFDKLAKRMAKRVQPSMPAENTNWVHSILTQVGKTVARTPEDLAREIGHSDSQTLEQFVAKANNWLRPVTVWDQLKDPTWRKGYKDLTVDELGLVHDSLKSIIKDGRDENKLIAQGKAEDFAEVRGKLVDAVSRLPWKDVEKQEARVLLQRVPQSFLARAKQMETIFGRWDQWDKYGDWTQYVLRDLIDGANQSDVWKEQFSKRLMAAVDKEDLSASVPNDLFKAPAEYGGHLLPMNRGGLRTVMLNWGNESNIAKITKGWGIDRGALEAWIHANAKKEDWDFAQKIWDIFTEARDMNNNMMRHLAEVPMQAVEAKAVETPFGTYKGGYYPLIRHRTYAPALEEPPASALMGVGYEGYEPPDRFKLARTEKVYPLALDLNGMPNRLSQMIHDTALRPAVLNAAKVFKDPKIIAAVRTHAGVDYADQLMPYLKGVANSSNTGMPIWGDGEALSSFMRRNLVSALVGYNPGTIMKHGLTAAGLSWKEVGAKYLYRGTKALFQINPETGESNYKFIMENVMDLARRHRTAYENLYGATGELSPLKRAELAGLNVTGPVGKAMRMREFIIENSGRPIAFSDWLSSVPTAMGAYLKAMDEGATKGDALFEAGRAVRRAHGSTAATNITMLQRGMNPWLTTFYNFFSDIHNRQMETLWRAGEMLKLADPAQRKAGMAAAAAFGAGTFAYMIWPAVVESLVSPMPSEPQDSALKRALKQQVFTEGATLPVVRDLTNALLEAKDPAVGLMSTELKSLVDMYRDFGKREPFSPLHAQKMIRDAGELTGALTGTPQQLFKEGSAAYGLHAGTERPRGPWGWLTLGRFGTLKGHSATVEDYLQGRYDRRR